MFAVFASILLAGCTVGPQKSNKVVVYTTIYPLYDFTQRIGGEHVEVVPLLRPGMDAHGFELSPKQIVGMEQANLIVINGAGMETWMDKLSDNIKNKILDTSTYVHLIERSENGEEHHHEEHEEQDHEEDDHDHGPIDPHIWLSVSNAIKQMEAIKNKLVEIDSKNATDYQNNFEAAKLMFTGLDNAYKEVLATENLATTTFVVSHRAFEYLAHDYGLSQYSISGIETNTDPLPSQMAEIIDYINANNIKAVFYQTEANSKVAEEIARSTGAKMLKLSSIESLTQEDIARGQNYVTIMYQNLINLKNGLYS